MTIYDSKIYVGSAYFREARHVYGINQKGYMSVNIAQIEDETTLNRVH